MLSLLWPKQRQKALLSKRTQQERARHMSNHRSISFEQTYNISIMRVSCFLSNLYNLFCSRSPDPFEIMVASDHTFVKKNRVVFSVLVVQRSRSHVRLAITCFLMLGVATIMPLVKRTLSVRCIVSCSLSSQVHVLSNQSLGMRTLEPGDFDQTSQLHITSPVWLIQLLRFLLTRDCHFQQSVCTQTHWYSMKQREMTNQKCHCHSNNDQMWKGLLILNEQMGSCHAYRLSRIVARMQGHRTRSGHGPIGFAIIKHK